MQGNQNIVEGDTGDHQRDSCILLATVKLCPTSLNTTVLLCYTYFHHHGHQLLS